MRKIIVLIGIILLLNLYSNGQSYDTIASRRYGLNNETINNLDIYGQRQGKWIYYKMFFNTQCSALSPSFSDTCFIQLSKGFYKDNNKVGEWEYYIDKGCLFIIEKTEKYLSDGSILEQKYSNSTLTNYNKDSSIVISTIYLSNNDTINIRCEKGMQCQAKFRGKLICDFPYEKLELKQYSFVDGIYDKKIKLMKD